MAHRSMFQEVKKINVLCKRNTEMQWPLYELKRHKEPINITKIKIFSTSSGRELTAEMATLTKVEIELQKRN